MPVEVGVALPKKLMLSTDRRKRDASPVSLVSKLFKYSASRNVYAKLWRD
jgi:hypothetical protein